MLLNRNKKSEKLILNENISFMGMNLKEMGATIAQEKHEDKTLFTVKTGFPTNKIEQAISEILKDKITKLNPSFDLTFDPFIKAHQTQLTGKGLKGVKNTIAVASGKGGVGKSTVAINLAVSLAKQGARVGILDADIYGPSIPLMMGKADGVELEGEKYKPVKAHGIEAMSIGYLTDENQALIWRGPMLAKSLLQMINITLWDELDYLFIDLPPGTGDIQLSLVQKIPLTAAIVVTTPQNVATLDAQKAIAMFEKTNVHVLGLIENMSLHECSNCGHQEPIFGSGGAESLSQKKHVPLLGQLPLNNKIREHADIGSPITCNDHNTISETFDKVALRAAIELASRPINYAGKFPEVVVE